MILVVHEGIIHKEIHILLEMFQIYVVFCRGNGFIKILYGKITLAYKHILPYGIVTVNNFLNICAFCVYLFDLCFYIFYLH